MRDLAVQIEKAFGSEPLPSEQELVKFDGFDHTGKEYLLTNLGGKTQDEVLSLLRAGTLGTGAMVTEELEVAEPAGIRYYLAPFLVDLAESISLNPRALDDETPFFLFFNIRNILVHRGKQIFTESQLMAISTLVKHSEKVLSLLPEGIWTEDVSKNLRSLRDVLELA